MLAQLTNARDTAQNELASAEIVLLEANAAAETLREEVYRLEAAVAVLSGEKPPAEPQTAAQPVESTQIGTKDTPNGDIHEMTPEEFDAERKRKQRAREKENQANNPLAGVKCQGCGQLGTMADTIIQAPSGATVRMMVCGSCGNQVMT